MLLSWLELADYRSYSELEWHPDPGVNLLIGPNGAGKTNVLEAVAYLASLSSFRGVSDDLLVADEAERAYIRAGIDRGGDFGEALIEIELAKRGSRRTQVDKQRLRRNTDLIEAIRVVTFLPEDLDIVKRGPGLRRDWLDAAAVQIRPSGAADFSEYDRALRQRNAFLKMGADDPVTLSVWDERLSQAGGKVMARRATVINELTPHMQDSYQAIGHAAAALAIHYASDWGASADVSIGAPAQAEALGEALAERRRHDMERRVTTVGPHRDDPTLVLDGHDVRVHGSQGEQRTTALALRLATHRGVVDRTGVVPVLVLDDVFSELDEGRAHRLATTLPEAQTLITSARPEELPVSGRRWDVGHGKVVGEP